MRPSRAHLVLLSLTLTMTSWVTCAPDLCECAPHSLCQPPHYNTEEDRQDCAAEGQVCCSFQQSQATSCDGAYRAGDRLVPWMVAIKNVTSSKFLGAGTLIHPAVVLTSAHIFQDLNADELELQFGSTSLNQTGVPLHQVYAIIRHESFNKQWLSNDIALLVLKVPVQLENSNLQVLCLPAQGESFDMAMCLFAGWGVNPEKLSGDQTTNDMRIPKFHVLPRSLCQQDLRNSATFSPWLYLHSSFICAVADSVTQRTCKGDAGGALFCPQGGHYVQAGLASWAEECTGKETTPSVFTNVARFRDWIDDKIGVLHDGVADFQL